MILVDTSVWIDFFSKKKSPNIDGLCIFHIVSESSSPSVSHRRAEG